MSSSLKFGQSSIPLRCSDSEFLNNPNSHGMEEEQCRIIHVSFSTLAYPPVLFLISIHTMVKEVGVLRVRPLALKVSGEQGGSGGL